MVVTWVTWACLLFDGLRVCILSGAGPGWVLSIFRNTLRFGVRGYPRDGKVKGVCVLTIESVYNSCNTSRSYREVMYGVR